MYATYYCADEPQTQRAHREISETFPSNVRTNRTCRLRFATTTIFGCSSCNGSNNTIAPFPRAREIVLNAAEHRPGYIALSPA